MRPNRPARSPFGPAVKYRWSSAPLAAVPLPNWSAHRPPMNSGWPLFPFSVPLGVHVPSAFSRNALMRPSPKLPISRSPPKKPKFAGASAVPHGAFRTPPGLAMRARKLPLRSNALTTPSPAPGSSRMPDGALAGVRDDDPVADRLDPVGAVAGGQVRVHERARRVDELPLRVDDVDPVVGEVGRVEPRTDRRRRRRDREAHVDRADARARDPELRVVVRDAAAPAADLAAQRVEDEVRRLRPAGRGSGSWCRRRRPRYRSGRRARSLG